LKTHTHIYKIETYFTYILYITNTRMRVIETIKKAGLMCDDVVNYIILDYLVGDKKHWTTQFNICIEAIDFCCIANWVWERAHDYYEEESDIEFWEAMEAFESSNTYITEFRLSVFNNEFSCFL
jgi:hypothetical protein